MSKRIRKRKPLPIIGWREWVSLPQLGVESVKAKIDTGARSSSLHAYSVQEFEQEGRKMVRFRVKPVQHDARTVVECEAELVDYRNVKSSGGHVTRRPVIRTTVEALGLRWPVEITLARRDTMGFRMLLGRQAIRSRFLVNPGKSFVGGHHTQEES